MSLTVDPTDLRVFTRRLTERLRLLRAQETQLPSLAHPFLRSVVNELEDSAEELSVTEEELRVQNEALTQSAEQLEGERLRTRRLFELAPGALLVTDAFGTIRDVNRAASRLLAVPRDRLPGKPLALFLRTAGGRFGAYVAEVGRVELAPALSVMLQPRGGEPVRVSVRAAAMPASYHSGRELIWSVVPASDPDGAAARPRTDEAARDSRRAMAELSHEIRTPLHSILGYAALLLEGVPQEVPETSRGQVRAIAAAARHLAGVVDDVLTLARAGDAAHPLDLAQVDLADMLHECAALVRGRAEAASLAFEVFAPATPELRTDRSKLREIVINLLGNAIKFTREGGVTLTAAADGERIVITVQDTGPGIEAAELAHIFEPFWRGDRAVRERTDGAGLGLALVRSLVDRLGGELTLDTGPGRGATFRISLPPSIEG